MLQAKSEVGLSWSQVMTTFQRLFQNINRLKLYNSSVAVGAGLPFP